MFGLHLPICFSKVVNVFVDQIKLEHFFPDLHLLLRLILLKIDTDSAVLQLLMTTKLHKRQISQSTENTQIITSECSKSFHNAAQPL